MKIAVASDDQKTIAGHFGRTRGFMIYTVEGDQIVDQNYRLNDFTGHSRGAHHEAGHHHGHGAGGFTDRHAPVLQALSDCQVVCARGMGRMIYEDLARTGIEVFVVNELFTDEAVRKYISNALADHLEKSCEHD